MADLTPDLQVCLSWGLIAKSFHSLQSLSVSCFHVILGLPGPRFPSTCMWKAVLTAPLELKIYSQNGCHSGQFEFLIGTTLGIFDLQVSAILPTKIWISWPFGSGEEALNSFFPCFSSGDHLSWTSLAILVDLGNSHEKFDWKWPRGVGGVVILSKLLKSHDGQGTLTDHNSWP